MLLTTDRVDGLMKELAEVQDEAAAKLAPAEESMTAEAIPKKKGWFGLF